MRKNFARAAIALAAIAFLSPAIAQSVAGSFAKGRTHFVATAGTGYAFDDEYWCGSDPKMTKITPSVQYVFYQGQAVKPYVGAFYRRTNIDGLADLDSVGAVHESYLDCESNVYRKCDSTYAEISVTFAF